jgi:hypothetical protein
MPPLSSACASFAINQHQNVKLRNGTQKPCYNDARNDTNGIQKSVMNSAVFWMRANVRLRGMVSVIILCHKECWWVLVYKQCCFSTPWFKTGSECSKSCCLITTQVQVFKQWQFSLIKWPYPFCPLTLNGSFIALCMRQPPTSTTAENTLKEGSKYD